MSNIIILSLLSLGLFVSFSFIYSAKHEMKIVEYTEIQGSEMLSTKKVEVGAFHSVESFDQMKVILIQGERNVEISAEDNLLEYVKVENKDGVLHVYRKFEKNQEVKQRRPMVVTVSNPNFETLTSHQQSEILIQGLLESESLSIRLMDQSNIKGQVNTEEITIKATQQSNIELSGNSGFLDINLQDQAGIRGGNLLVEKAQVEISSQTKAHVNVSESIGGAIRGQAKISISGNPKVNNLQTANMEMITN